LQSGLDEVVTVDDNATAEAILWLLERSKQVVEGAGAVGLAALLSGSVKAVGPTVIILSGGNVDSNQLVGVIRHGLTSVGRYVRLETHLPDRPGELSRLLILLADLRVNVLNVDHRREGVQMHVGQARIDLTLQTRDADHLALVLKDLEQASYQARVMG
jgi:threonine dehydratase